MFSKYRFIITTCALIGGLLFAYYAEFYLSKDPCILCVYTRHGFKIAILAGLIACFYKKLSWLLSCTLLGLSILSGFHVGVEQKWWKGPDACQVNIIDTKGLSQEDAMKKLKESLVGKRPVRCDEVNWRIFGISATLWNTLFLISLLGLSFPPRRHTMFS